MSSARARLAPGPSHTPWARAALPVPVPASRPQTLPASHLTLDPTSTWPSPGEKGLQETSGESQTRIINKGDKDLEIIMFDSFIRVNHVACGSIGLFFNSFEDILTHNSHTTRFMYLSVHSVVFSAFSKL